MSFRLLVAAVMELTVEEKTTMPRTKTSSDPAITPKEIANVLQ